MYLKVENPQPGEVSITGTPRGLLSLVSLLLSQSEGPVSLAWDAFMFAGAKGMVDEDSEELLVVRVGEAGVMGASPVTSAGLRPSHH